MCNPPLDPPSQKEIGNCELCGLPLYRTDDKNELWDYCCLTCGDIVCDKCVVKCAQCGQRGCKRCTVHDLEHQEYFCDTAPMTVESAAERLKQSECRAAWLIAGEKSIVDGVAAELGIGE